MNLSHYEMLIRRLNATKLPLSLDFLDLFVGLDWTAETEDEVDVLCGIIIRLGADVITCAFDAVGSERAAYKAAFAKIVENIDASLLPSQSPDFHRYFEGYKKCLLELTTPTTS